MKNTTLTKTQLLEYFRKTCTNEDIRLRVNKANIIDYADGNAPEQWWEIAGDFITPVQKRYIVTSMQFGMLINNLIEKRSANRK
jgi:hypothetical protein